MGNSFTRRAARGAALLALGLSGVWSADASAQSTSTSTITIGRNVGRRLPDAAVGSEYHYRDARRWWINYDECVANEYFDFYVTLTNPRNRFEVWAGTEDCGAKRSLQDHGQCWIVASNDRPEQNFTISVPVRNIVANQVGTDSVEIPDPDALGSAVCEGSTDSDGVQVILYFFLQDGGQVVGTEQKWDPTNLGGVGYDLLGPEPPGGVEIGVGESQLTINLSGVDQESDRERFAAYCAPATMDPVYIPADGSAYCKTAALAQGGHPDPLLKCGEANETSDAITTDPGLPSGTLDNGQLYAIAVSGEDILGNAGPLSPLACGTPKELNDFFELYGGAGGPGGGGFCSVRPGVTRSAPGAMALLGAAFAALTLRRRRSRS